MRTAGQQYGPWSDADSAWWPPCGAWYESYAPPRGRTKPLSVIIALSIHSTTG